MDEHGLEVLGRIVHRLIDGAGAEHLTERVDGLMVIHDPAVGILLPEPWPRPAPARPCSPASCHYARRCCSISAGSCADQRSAARATSSRFESFTCGTSRNITTVVRPWPLRCARPVARRKPLSWPVCLLNEARKPSTTSSESRVSRDTNRSGPKRCSGKVLGLIRLPSVPFLGAFSVPSRGPVVQDDDARPERP